MLLVLKFFILQIVPDPDGNSDEALKMLEAFVESYPDSDDQEIS